MYKVNNLSPYVEYNGNLNVTGILEIRSINNELEFNFSLQGLDFNSTGSWHLHYGLLILH